MKNRFNARTAVCMSVLFLMIFVSMLRIADVSFNENYGAAALNQTSYRLTAGWMRGTVFDTNMVPLTNQKTEVIASVLPVHGAVDDVRDVLLYETPEQLVHRLADGKPVLVRLKSEVHTKNVKSVTVRVNQTADSLACHLLGYTDGEGHGISGVQAAFDSYLYSGRTIDFLYGVSAAGDIIDEHEVSVNYDDSISQSGVRLTIDSAVQRALEQATGNLKSGAAVISEVGSGKIRGMVSYPKYDVTDVAKYLTDPSSPLINRAFCAYNVGSIFKPCVAAAALEDGVYDSSIYNCTGSREIAGKNFACHRASGHGVVDMTDAVALSCNTYFYSLAIKLGSQKIYDMASSLGFGTRYRFAENLYTEQGYLPTPEQVSPSEQSLANLAIGQGSLMLTPVSLLPLYEAIANGGVYHRPTLVEGMVENGAPQPQKENYPTRVMSEQTANKLKKSLYEVINRGTGTSARPTLCTAAGKTATAQTGWIKEGKAVDHSWLCGFFPADNPKYVVVIISENTSGDGTPCGPLFSAVCDAVFRLKLS
ncbi:MAG: penicillin-binding protein 2 [Clostridia bacterium]|nr:penicillin-binding protein 2 [Clostridia bacterium]